MAIKINKNNLFNTTTRKPSPIDDIPPGGTSSEQQTAPATPSVSSGQAANKTTLPEPPARSNTNTLTQTPTAQTTTSTTPVRTAQANTTATPHATSQDATGEDVYTESELNKMFPSNALTHEEKNNIEKYGTPTAPANTNTGGGVTDVNSQSVGLDDYDYDYDYDYDWEDSDDNSSTPSYMEMFRYLNPAPYEDDDKRYEREKRRAMWSALGDGISAIANLVGTSRGAYNSPEPQLSKKQQERLAKLDARRDAKWKAWQDQYYRAYKAQKDAERLEKNDRARRAYYDLQSRLLIDKNDRENQKFIAELDSKKQDADLKDIKIAKERMVAEKAKKVEVLQQRHANGEFKDEREFIEEVKKVDMELGQKLEKNLQDYEVKKQKAADDHSRAQAYIMSVGRGRSGGGGGRSSGGGSRGRSGGGRWRSGGGGRGGSYHGSGGGGSKIKTLKNPTFGSSYNLSDWSNTDKWNAFYSDSMYDLRNNFKNAKVWSAIPPGMKAALRKGPKAFKNYYYEVIRQGNNEEVIDVLVDVFNKFSNY